MDKQVIINLINAIIRDGQDATWCDSDIIEKLIVCGLTEQDFLEYGFGDFVADYFKEPEEEANMKLHEILTNEMVDFRKSYEEMSPTHVYNDWYLIGFKEEYYEMLMGDYVDWDDYEHIAEWLCKFEFPLQFLYSEWLSADGAFDHDWNAMFDFIEEVYRDCMRNNF